MYTYHIFIHMYLYIIHMYVKVLKIINDISVFNNTTNFYALEHLIFE